MKRGMFIVLDGPDGCGKTTQAELLANYLRRQGREVELEREPTSGPVGQLIRQMTGPGTDPDPVELALLFAADRQAHSRKILDLLAHGKDVVCDRYTMSSVVYQGLAMGGFNCLGWVFRLSMFTADPDIMLLIDGDVDECVRRIESRGIPADHFEQQEKQKRIHAAYKYVVPAELATKVVGVNGHGSIEVVADRIAAAVQQRIAVVG